MEINYNKLQDALECIKGVCEQFEYCMDCPLGCAENFCLLRKLAPTDWEPRHPKTHPFRVLE